MTRRLVVGLAIGGVLLVAALTAIRVFVAPVRAGPVVFEIEDPTGLVTNLQVRLPGQRWQREVTLPPGGHDVLVESVSEWQGIRSAFVHSTRRMWVLPWPTDVVRTVRFSYDVRLAPPAPDHAIRGQDEVEVYVLFPDGGVMPNADVMCDDQPPQLADERGAARCRVGRGAFDLWVGNAAFGRHLDVAARTTEVELTSAPGMEVRTTISGAQPTSLTFWSKADTIATTAWPGVRVFPGLPSMRTIVCALEHDVGACDVVMPDGGLVEAQLPIGPSGTLTFETAGDAGLIVYVDRRSHPPSHRLQLAPGKHVLVLNEPASSKRYEAVVGITSGKTTDLGLVELRDETDAGAQPR